MPSVKTIFIILNTSAWVVAIIAVGAVALLWPQVQLVPKDGLEKAMVEAQTAKSMSEAKKR